MSGKLRAGVMLLVVAILVGGLCWWIHDAPRRESLATLTRLDRALHSGGRAELLNLLIIPAAVQERAAAEQSEFLAKALHDEISPAGLRALRQCGAYGPLKKLFPAEAEAWAKQAGVNPEDCVALKLERHGLRAEVVLVKPSPLNSLSRQSEATAGQPSTAKAPYRVVRVNNVKQMADLKSVTAAQNP